MMVMCRHQLYQSNNFTLQAQNQQSSEQRFHHQWKGEDSVPSITHMQMKFVNAN